MTPELDGYLAALDRRLREHLGDGHVGTYVHGSAVLGGWHPDRSDVDMVAVCARPVGADALRRLAHALAFGSLPCSCERGLELSVVTAASAASPCAAPPFELHVTASRSGDRVVLGRDRPGDPDCMIHFAVCRIRGRAISGPPPSEVFGGPSSELLDAAFAGELAWAAAHAPPVYQVLNACRAWRFAVDRDLVSKVAGGEWALGRGADDAMIQAALAEQRGGPAGPIDASAAAALIARATAELRGGARYPEA